MSIRTALMVAALSLAAGAPAAEVPRYRFAPGQEWKYEGASATKYAGGSYSMKDDWTAWVLRRNDDGSHRLLFRKSTVAEYSAGGGTPQAAEVTLGYADVFDDGRFDSNASLAYHLNPAALLPLLPKDDAEVTGGWVRRDLYYDETTRFKTADLQSNAEVFVTETTRESPSDKVYRRAHRSTTRFDRRRGLVERAESESVQEAEGGRASATLALKSVGTRDASWMKEAAADAEVYFAADKRHEELTDRAANADGDIDALFAQAGAALAEAASKLKTELFRDQIKGKLAQHEGMSRSDGQTARLRAETLGKPAPDWELQDLDGRTHTLKDYRGKVVVLDFWYRNCSWCIRAMPQIKQLAEDYRGRPVAILGVNSDTKVEDARMVVEALGLPYPNLKADASDISQKYQIRGNPTLVIIDPAGKVAALYVGYTPTTRVDVARRIDALLTSDAAPASAPR